LPQYRSVKDARIFTSEGSDDKEDIDTKSGCTFVTFKWRFNYAEEDFNGIFKLTVIE
jgi:hypothetical protein